MNIIAIVDDNYGMMFNHRRQSRDHLLSSKILEISQYTCLRMAPYSKDLFYTLPDNVIVSENFLNEAIPGDICFVEDRALLPYAKKIDTIYLFHWNRSYPYDFRLDFIPSEQRMFLRKSMDFEGSSHNKITLEIWQRG